LDDFPEVVKRWMDERGMSVRALASAVHNDPSYISRVLRGLKPAAPDIARRIDNALGAGGEIIAVAARPAPRPEPEEHVAPELALYFASQLAGHYQADRFLGPGRLIPTAKDQYALLCEVAASSSGPLRADLWGIAAGYSACLGWLYQDAGDLTESGRWHDVMIERAHRTADDQLVAFALHCKAMLLGDMGDGRGVLDLTGAALRNRSRLMPKVQVLLLQQQAHGLALTGGGAASSLALLDEAARLLDRVDDDRPWGGQVRVPAYIDIQRATVCTRLGLAAEALALWDGILPVTARGRDLGVFRARRAQALAAAGEPDHAAEVAASAVPLAVSTGSARMRAELMVVREKMAPWRRDRAGRALDAALTGLSRLKGR
jgi:transcriptional regulator with XRE-family HTH domain